MKTQKIDIETQDGNCDSFVAYSEGHRTYPAVLFFMDGIGPRDYLYEMAEKIASRGYFVLLPNIFYRARRAPLTDLKFPISAEDLPKLFTNDIGPLFKTYDPVRTMQDVAVFLDFLAAQKQVAPGKIGVTGYCMGSALAIRTAALFPERVAAAAGFHGGSLVTETPDSPHLLLNRIQAELYIAHADNDQHMTPEQIDRFQKALEQSGIRYEAELYKGAAHGFTMMDLPMYNESALQRHWTKLFALFERSLK